jgi:hypothetical protein
MVVATRFGLVTRAYESLLLKQQFGNYLPRSQCESKSSHYFTVAVVLLDKCDDSNKIMFATNTAQINPVRYSAGVSSW